MGRQLAYHERLSALRLPSLKIELPVSNFAPKKVVAAEKDVVVGLFLNFPLFS